MGLDTQYHRESYFWAQQRNVKLVSDIKGAGQQALT